MKESPWEDNLLERKLESDLKDLLKTLVGFSNSIKPGHTAILLIGEKDNGEIQGVKNPDNIQKKVRNECDKIYPSIIWRSKIYEKDEKNCIRVEIEYSGNTPHFGGQAWVRKGSKTIKSTDEVFQSLINLRSSTIYEIAKWLNKKVTVHSERTIDPNLSSFDHIIDPQWKRQEIAKICFVNNHWVTFEKTDGEKVSEPLNKLSLSFDDSMEQLKVILC